MDYNFKTVYKQGSQHLLPDALSRNVEIGALHHILNEVKTKKKKLIKTKALPDKVDFSFIFSKDNVSKEQDKDERWRDLKVFLKGGKIPYSPPRTSLNNFSLLNDCLYFSSNKDKVTNNLKLVVPDKLIDFALKLCHDSENSVHVGFLKTLFKCQNMFYWPNMVLNIKDYCKKCLSCLKRKAGVNNKSQWAIFPQFPHLMNA